MLRVAGHPSLARGVSGLSCSVIKKFRSPRGRDPGYVGFLFWIDSFSEQSSWEPRIMSEAALTEVEERHSREAIEAEIVRFEERIRDLQSGAITPEQFRPFRLKSRTYGHRPPAFHMLLFNAARAVLRPAC